MSSHVNTKEKEAESGGFWSTFILILQALLIAVIVRIFLYQPFNIPSGSMKPTLLIGDYLFVSKFSYGYSKYSFPWGPDIFSGRVWGAQPERGDVVVFKWPHDNSTDYIKRLVGLPGDRIQLRSGMLYINGQLVPKRQIEDFALTEPNGRVRKVARYMETLPNGVSYEVLDLEDGKDGDDTNEFVVPSGHYFMLGDNRDNSADSRWWGNRGVGFVPEENLVGRAEVLFFSVSEQASLFAPWRWPFEIRWSRFFDSID